MSGTIRIGTSGWNYKHWIGPFYPPGLPQKELLSFYVEHFDTLEINNSFYKLPESKTIISWREHVPKTFTFSVKASRFITHMKKLRAPKTSTNKLFNRLEKFDNKLGPILFQLPPRWHVNPQRLTKFLEAMPSKHQYAFEFRDQSWLTSEIYELLTHHNIAFCIHDFGGKKTPFKITASFTYIRFHGTGATAYTGSYPSDLLKRWAHRIRSWRNDLEDVYVYFNNDPHANAVRNAKRLRELV